MCILMPSVADPNPGSGAFLTLGSGSRIKIFGSLISRYPTHLSESFCFKILKLLCQLTQIFFCKVVRAPVHVQQIKYVNFAKFMAAKKVGQLIKFCSSSLLSLLDPGSKIRDGKTKPDPG